MAGHTIEMPLGQHQRRSRLKVYKNCLRQRLQNTSIWWWGSSSSTEVTAAYLLPPIDGDAAFLFNVVTETLKERMWHLLLQRDRWLIKETVSWTRFSSAGSDKWQLAGEALQVQNRRTATTESTFKPLFYQNKKTTLQTLVGTLEARLCLIR